MFLTLKIFNCLSNSLIFLFTDNNKISQFFLSFFSMSKKDLPMDPVDPKSAIFFFHINLKNLAIIHQKEQQKLYHLLYQVVHRDQVEDH